jgi:hypothetical protein
MIKQTSFVEIFSHPESFLGQRVAINCALVIRGGECYLASSIDAYDSIQRIEIFSPGLEEKLNLLVGGWVGGPANYLDTVEITGTLSKGTTQKYPLSISNIKSLKLSRDDESYLIDV